MTISMTETALDIEKKAMKRCAWRSPLRNWLVWIYCGMFLGSFAGFYVFWYSNTFRDYVLSYLQLRNGTQVFDWWRELPFNFSYNIYIFNYTNVEDFEAGRASKLHVQELGPYMYSEKIIRTNVVMHQNGTLTYDQKKVYHWIGGKSADEVIVVPNVLLMFATALVRDLNFAMRFSLSTVLSTLHEKTFVNLTAGGFIWGYDSPLYEMAKPLLMLQQNVLYDKFGLLAVKNNSEINRITIHTGIENMDNLGEIDQVNGLQKRNIWDDEQCDKIKGSDGSIFPPSLIRNRNSVLDVYSKELCRNLPFSFSEERTIYGIPSLRYKLLPDIFTSPDDCFCSKVDSKKVCPPIGIFNISTCNDNMPLLSSFPHFYGGEKSLLEEVDGLNPRQEDHESYLDVHAFFAKTIVGYSRLQVNLEVRKAVGVPFLGNLKDGTILPLIWIEGGVNDLPQIVLDAFDNSYFLVQTMEMVLQWLTVIVMLISLSALITYFWKYRSKSINPFKKTYPVERIFLNCPE